MKKLIKRTKLILINLFIFFLILYLIEITINIYSGNFLKKTRYQHLNDLRIKHDEKFFFNFFPYKLLQKENLKTLPLSGYPDSWTLLCLDDKKPIYYKSDENGFNNNTGKNSEILLLGDSFVQGMCVENNKNVGAFLGKKNLKTSSLGVGGHGPLFSLAVLREYGEYYKHNKLIYFITPDNDFNDLTSEIQNPILFKYLEDPLFNQNLLMKRNTIKKILDNYFKKTLRKNREFLRAYHLDLHNIRSFIKKVKRKEIEEEEVNYNIEDKINKIFFKILNEMNKSSFEKKRDFYVVINLINPEIFFSKNKVNIKLKKNLVNKIKITKKYLNDNKINFFDFNEYIFEKYNEENISKISHFNNGRWDHYSEFGNKVMADKIFEHLIK